MKKVFTLCLIIAAFAPITAAAQSTEESVILDLLKSLDAPLSLSKPVSTAASPTPTVKKTPQTQQPSTPQQVLAPGFLFNIDTNTPQPDPLVGTMQATLSSLIAQFAAVASSAPAVTATASTTAATSTAKPPIVYKRTLTIGSRGADVTALQEFLIMRKLLFGEATGYFGILTKTAVAQFQTEQGIDPTGVVGIKTRTLLNSLPADPIQPVPPPVSFGIPKVPFISSSTSMTIGTTSTSSAGLSSTTPMFDWLAPPVSVTMSLLPTEAPVGGSTAITWIAQNATSCEASDGWSGPKPTIGAARIEPLEFSLNFVLTCTGPGGIASTTALVVVGGEQ